MTDASPRIFRTLERSIGRDEFDTIVRAAVVSYAALKRPTEAQAREFGRLVTPFFAKVGAETRRMLAASLCASPRLPRDVVGLLLNEPIEVSAPFLLGSPTLLPDDLANLANRRERAVAEILDRRGESESMATRMTPKQRKKKVAVRKRTKTAPTPSAAVAALDNGRQMALLTAAPSANPCVSPDAGDGTRQADAAESTSVTQVRETLRRLALTGRQTAAAIPAKPADLLSAAVAGDLAVFDAMLQQQLRLASPALAAIQADATGQELATALAALSIGHADALTILMMVKPELGRNVASFEAMAVHYRSLDPATCAAKFAGTRSTLPVAHHKPQYEAPKTPSRAEPRVAFGRRKTAPKLKRDIREA